MASENLGEGAGLLAAAALMIDYILTAAVGISAGVTALTSSGARACSRTRWLLCLVILAILAIVNMRGVKDTGAAFIAADVSVCRDAAGADRGGGVQDGVGGRASGAGGADCRRRCRRRCRCVGAVAAAEGVRQRMRGDDGRGGGIERGDGVQRAAGEEGAAHADGDHRDPDRAAVRDLRSWRRRTSVMAMDPDAHGLPEPAELAGDGGVRAWLVLLPDDGQRAAGAGA